MLLGQKKRHRYGDDGYGDRKAATMAVAEAVGRRDNGDDRSSDVGKMEIAAVGWKCDR